MIEALAVGIGTYLLRYVPMNVRLRVSKEKLEDVTAAVISALFVTSFLNFPLGTLTLLDGVSLAIAAVAYRITKNMGAAILVATVFNAAVRIAWL